MSEIILKEDKFYTSPVSIMYTKVTLKDDGFLKTEATEEMLEEFLFAVVNRESANNYEDEVNTIGELFAFRSHYTFKELKLITESTLLNLALDLAESIGAEGIVAVMDSLAVAGVYHRPTYLALIKAIGNQYDAGMLGDQLTEENASKVLEIVTKGICKSAVEPSRLNVKETESYEEALDQLERYLDKGKRSGLDGRISKEAFKSIPVTEDFFEDLKVVMHLPDCRLLY